jgi:hypothetical protein
MRAGQKEDAPLRPDDPFLEMWIAVKGRPSTRAAFFVRRLAILRVAR